jgi:hypothetical protein
VTRRRAGVPASESAAASAAALRPQPECQCPGSDPTAGHVTAARPRGAARRRTRSSPWQWPGPGPPGPPGPGPGGPVADSSHEVVPGTVSPWLSDNCFRHRRYRSLDVKFKIGPTSGGIVDCGRRGGLVTRRRAGPKNARSLLERSQFRLKDFPF